MVENEEELKSVLIEVKEESEKAGLQLNIQKTKIMAFSPITSWQIDGDTMETVTKFILLGFKITADGDYSHEIKICLLFGKMSIQILYSHLDWIIGNKGTSSHGYGFSSSHVWM